MAEHPGAEADGTEVLELVATSRAGRLDAWLASQLPQSRSRLTSLVKLGAVTVDGASVKPKHKLLGGERIVVRLPPAPPSELVAQDIPLDVLYADDHLLVVDKPVGMVVHPAKGHPDGTLVNAVLGLLAGERPGDPARPGIVHRLDKGTSGVMVVARTPDAHAHLSAQFAARSVERRYAAVVRGAMKTPRGTVDAPLARHPRDRLRFAVVEGGKRAVTHWTVLQERALGAAGAPQGGVVSLVECRLETGRTHQIRVHLTHVGRPLLGDPVYGGKQRVPRAIRDEMSVVDHQLLHAWRLGFVHPATGRYHRFATTVPSAFGAVLATLGFDDPARGKPRSEVHDSRP